MEEMNDRITRAKTHYYTAFDALGVREIRATEANMSFFERFPTIKKKGENLDNSADLSQRHSKLLNRTSYSSYMDQSTTARDLSHTGDEANDMIIMQSP